MKELKPSVKAYDFVSDIRHWLKENKSFSSCELDAAFSDFFTESNSHSMSNGCLFNFHFPKNKNDYRFKVIDKELHEELFKILSMLEQQIGKSEMKVYYWW